MSESKQRIISLTTDFGTQDGYIGIVKAVIIGICPDVRIIDLSHDLPPWNIAAAAWVLGNSFQHFPSGSIHVGVVDPGVGSSRRAVALEAADHIFVGPDNGIFSKLLHTNEVKFAVELTEEQYWRKNLSSTFHARDVFGPVAAHYATGVSLKQLGKEIDIESLLRLPAREIQVRQNRVEGSVAYVDHFGNLITNIKKDMVRESALCQVGKRSIGRIKQTYSSGDLGAPLAFIGSHGYLEIAVSQGRADEKLDAGVNTTIILFEGTGTP